MSVDIGLVIADLPSGPGWDLGGFPYGLEPLTLPTAGTPDLVSGAVTQNGYGEACLRVLATDRDTCLAAGVPGFETADELFWFRWITGHQISFVIWRLMALTTAETLEERIDLKTALAALRVYVRGYTAMLIYTGSCSRGVYQSVIRPSMYLRHRGFSGNWAPDYRLVRDLFRGRRSPFVQAPESAGLAAAVNLYRVVHDGVAAKLVPEGRSLLQASASKRRPQSMGLLNLIYDNYFLTIRASVPRQEVTGQLLRRLIAVAQDIAVNDLYPVSVCDPEEKSAELRRDDVVACETELARILYEVAAQACGLPADQQDPAAELVSNLPPG